MEEGVRHGPFDIQGGGVRAIFCGQNRSKIIFFAGPSGRIIFFYNRKLPLWHIGLRDYFMLNSDFRDNFMLSRHPHTQI